VARQRPTYRSTAPDNWSLESSQIGSNSVFNAVALGPADYQHADFGF
jgi:hypothetical protein